MKYLGSKRRIAKEILPIMEAVRGDRAWVEPFVGGCNLIDKVKGRRIGGDAHYYLIALLKAIQDGWIPPTSCSEDEYKELKNNREHHPPELVGFVGFSCSFAGVFFNGYARNSQGRNYAEQGHNNLLKQAPNLKGIELHHCTYDTLEIPPESLIYCDPPYANTRQYIGKNGERSIFKSEEFFEWCIEKKKEGHIVFLSEANAPFECLWEKEISLTVSNNNITEKRSRFERLYRI